ncbi:N-acetylneuraminate epimerase [compost metagenome]
MIELLNSPNPLDLPVYPDINGVYRQRASASLVRSSHSIACIGDKLYTIGGNYGSLLPATLEVYDIPTDTWGVVSSINMPVARHGSACCVSNGKFYIFGGSLGNGWSPMTNEAYVYDPTDNVWTKLENTPNAVALHSAVPINGKIYLFGGFDGGNQSSAFYEYDPITNTYRTIPNGQSPIHGHRGVVIRNRMYLLGGAAGAGATNRLISYDPVSNTWAGHSPSPLGHTYAFAGVLGDNLYLFGGSLNTNTTTNKRLFKYNINTDSWTELPSGASPRYLGWMAVSDKALYLHGGYDNSLTYKELWEIT